MRKALLLTAALSLVLAPAATTWAQETATVTVIHGVPGLTVDVYVNGDPTLENFEPETVTEPLQLPPGDYEIEIREAGAPADSDPAIAGSASVEADMNATIVAHLDEGGAPILTAFVNDTSEIGAGDARVVVRHTAAAPAVDVLAADDPLFTDLANPDEAAGEVPADIYEIAVAAAGTTDAVIGPADLTFPEGTATIVYAIGSLENDSLTVVTQSIEGLHSSPAGVPAGNSGLATEGSFPLLAILLLGAAALALAASGVAYVRHRT